MVADGFLVGRKVNRLVDEKFPDNTESGWKLGLLRRHPRLAVAPDAGAAAAGEPRRSRRLTAVRVLVLGGIRSGKSQWAETAIAEAVSAGQPVRYLATGAVPDGDAAWSARVAAHRDRRPPHWLTVETVDVPTQLRSDTAIATLVDDLGGWLTATMDRRGAWTGGSVAADVDDLIDAVERLRLRAGAGQPRGGADGGARNRSPVAGSPTSWARSISDWPRCATAWCWWWPASRSR